MTLDPIALFRVPVLLALIFFSGCQRADDGLVHLQFSFWGSVAQQQIEREIVAEFERTHPGVRIGLLPVGSRYAEKLQAMMVGDVAPDIIMVEVTQSFEWASRGVLLDLTEDMRAAAGDLSLMPVPEKTFGGGGQFHSLPVNCHGYAMYYNKDALAKAGVEFPSGPVTWDWIESVAPRLSRRHGDPDAPTDYALLMPLPIIAFWQHGASLFDDDSAPTRVTVNSPESEAAIAFLRRVEASGFAVPPDVANEQGTYELFRDGRVAFFFSGRWATPNFVGHTDFEWDVAPMPAGPVSAVTYHGGTGLAVYQRTKHPAEAREFVRFYASRLGAEIAMHGGRYAPPYRELAFGREFLALRPPESMWVFSETMERGAARTMLYAPGADDVSRIFYGRMQQAMSLPGLPASQVLKGMEEDLQRWLDRRAARR